MVDYEEVRAYAAAQILAEAWGTDAGWLPGAAATEAVEWADALIAELKKKEDK